MSDTTLSFNEDGILLPVFYRIFVYEKVVNKYIKPSTVNILVEYCCLRHDIKDIADRNNITRERVRQILSKYQRSRGIKNPVYERDNKLEYIKLLVDETQTRLKEIQLELNELQQQLKNSN